VFRVDSQNQHPFKLLFFILTFLIVSTTFGFAQFKQQQIEVTPFAGYFLTSNLSTLDGDLIIDHNFNYGGVLDIRVSDDLFIELLYNRTNTEVRFKQEYFDTVKYLFDMSIEYFQAGAHVETETGNFRPFAAFTLGATYFKPKDDDINSELEFSFTAGGGIKYYFTENLAARLQWRFLIPVYFSSASVFCSDGYCGIFITGGTYLLQYDLTAGIAFSF
jgi:opacity protein-like surface antigen